MHKVLSNKIAIFYLVAPGFIVFIFAIIAPIFLSGYYGMTDYTGLGIAQFTGIENFKKLITDDPVFWRSLMNALLLGIGFILIQHPFCLSFAIIIDRIGGRVEKFFRAVFFIPCVISVVVTSKMWVSILDPKYGLLNKLLESVGLGALSQQWLGDPTTALISILIICMWQGFGWGMLIYYAGLKGIPEELYEAARIDGASNMSIYTKITLPLLKPVIRINFTLAIIAALKQMETVYLTTNGGPGNTTQFLGNYLYARAFGYQQYGYASAISVLFVIVCLVVTISIRKLVKYQVWG